MTIRHTISALVVGGASWSLGCSAAPPEGAPSLGGDPGTMAGSAGTHAGGSVSSRGGASAGSATSQGGAGSPATSTGGSAEAAGGAAVASAAGSAGVGTGLGGGGASAGGATAIGGNSATQGGMSGMGSGGTGEPPAPPENLPDGVLDMFPLPDAVDLCSDPSLYVRFDQPVSLAPGGRFVVVGADAPAQPVVTVDPAQSSVTLDVGGASLRVPPPVFLVASTPGGATDAVVVSLAAGRFERGRTYRVVLEGDPLVDDQGNAVLSADFEWTFATRSDPAPSGPQLTLGYTSAADYCSLQGALDAADDGARIDVEPGTYLGLARLGAKSGISLLGRDRDNTRFVGTNNEQLNGGTRARPLFLVQGASDLTIENVTIQNLTPQGGSQAEALAMLDCDKCVVRDSTIESLQDTLLWQGRIYAERCLVIGNVDYIWGTGTAYFQECEIRTVGRKGYNLQARNAAGSYGYVFVDSKLTADDGITGDILARIEIDRFPGSQVAYVDCEMGSHIAPEGWLITGGAASSQLRFWEYRSRTPSGGLVDTSRRAAGSRQMTEAEAQELRDPANVLGGWSP